MTAAPTKVIRQAGMFTAPSQTLAAPPRPTQDIPARWLVSTIDNALAMLHARRTQSSFAEPLHGDERCTGLVHSSARHGGRMKVSSGCAKRVDWKATNSDWFFLATKRVVAGRERGRKGAVGANLGCH